MYNSLLGFLTPGADDVIQPGNISGTIEGTMIEGTYTVTGDILVASGTSLTINPGCVIEFDGVYIFEVQGEVQAIGTSAKHIEWKISAGNASGYWRGVYICDDGGCFSFGAHPDSSAENKFHYCDFSDGDKTNQLVCGYNRNRGCAIFAYQFDYLEIENCTFTDMISNEAAGAIYFHPNAGATVSFQNNTFTRCKSLTEGGAWKSVHGSFSASGLSYSDCESCSGDSEVYSVNTSTDVFTIRTHDLQDGDPVAFHLSGDAPGGFTDGRFYYVIRVSSTEFKLADTESDAIAGTAISVTSAPSNDPNAEIKILTASFSVDTGTDIITTDTGFANEDGVEVVFRDASNTPGGLTAGTTYYVIRQGTNFDFKLASSLSNAYAGTPESLTSSPSGVAELVIGKNYTIFDGTVTIS